MTQIQKANALVKTVTGRLNIRAISSTMSKESQHCWFNL